MKLGGERFTPEKEIISSEGRQFESDIDRAIYEIYGSTGLESFNNLHEHHPELSLEELIKLFEQEGRSPQTYFFRTPNLRTIAKYITPKMETQIEQITKERVKHPRPVQILDVGCSTGEEPYSLSVEMLEVGHTNFEITAIDASPKRIEAAQQAEYNYDEFYGLGGRGTYYFDKGYFENTGKRWEKKMYVGPLGQAKKLREIMRIKGKLPDHYFETVEHPIICPTERVREHVNFSRHDIIDKPLSGKFDIIMMNNVLPHYPPRTREMILRNALASLKPRGFLVLEPELAPAFCTKDLVKWADSYNKWKKTGVLENLGLEEVDPSLEEGEKESPISYLMYYRYSGEGI